MKRIMKCIIDLIRYRRLLKQGLRYEQKQQEEIMVIGKLKLKLLELKGEKEYWM